jgi:hypothetical protein
MDLAQYIYNVLFSGDISILIELAVLSIASFQMVQMGRAAAKRNKPSDFHLTDRFSLERSKSSRKEGQRRQKRSGILGASNQPLRIHGVLVGNGSSLSRRISTVKRMSSRKSNLGAVRVRPQTRTIKVGGPISSSKGYLRTQSVR